MFGLKSKKADLAVFHEFVPPPTGGGHQFMRALTAEFEGRGLELEYNRLSKGTPACLFNSFNFDFKKLRRAARQECRMVHRVDGPISVYRGFDDGTDGQIASVNEALADATVCQSRFSLNAHREIGIELADPVVIPNAADPAIFYPAGDAFGWKDRIKLVSTSWSDNPNKGLDVYQWLDQHLDFRRYEYHFIGRIKEGFSNIQLLPPMVSGELAEQLREADIFITASRNDPASNSVVEAMACGLPVIYLNSGGHPELAGDAGLPFNEAEDIPGLVESLVADYKQYVGRLAPARIKDVADQYLEVLGLA